MNKHIKRFLLTIGFMTQIPVNVDLGQVTDEDMHKGFVFFPLVGLIIGAFDALVFLLVSLVLPPVFGIIFGMLANFFITGAFHLDGLSDTADGIYSSRTRERMLEIMKDSRIGTNGAIAMCFDIMIKFTALTYMPADKIWLMLLMMPVAGKMIQGALVYKAIYPREKGIGIYVGTIDRSTVTGSVIVGLIFMGVAFSYIGIGLFAVLYGLAFLFRRYIEGKIGGITGDIMGAGSELAEIELLLLTLILCRFAGFPPSLMDIFL